MLSKDPADYFSEQHDCDLSGVNTIEDTSALHDYVAKRKLRRIDHFSRMALLAAGRALENAESGFVSKERTGLIIATGFGALKTTFDFLDSYIDKGDKLSSPTHFSNSVHNAAAAHISICYGITGPALTISQFDLSFVSALITAGAWLDQNKADSILIGTSDEFCDVIGYCIDRFGDNKQCKDYSFSESAVFFLVTRDDQKSRHGYIEEAFISSFEKEKPKVPENELVVLSNSAVVPCGNLADTFMKECSSQVHINKLRSPSDCGVNLMFAGKTGEKVNYIKIGQNGSFGRLVFSNP